MNESTTLLIVDDDQHIRQLIRTSLDNGRRRILEAGTARDGLHRVIDIQPHILLVDIGLPGHFDGFSLCEALTNDPQHRKIKIIVVSGHSDPEDIERAKRLGIAAYVVKPFSPRDLSRLVDDIEIDIHAMPVLKS